MFWKIELDKEGSILSCESVEQIGKNGGRVIFVEAETKVDACKHAKDWHTNRKNYMRSFHQRRKEQRLKAGLCTSCGKQPPKQGRKTCKGCATRKPSGNVRELLTPEEAARRQQQQSMNWHKRRGGSRGVTLRKVLSAFDGQAPYEFRQWLVAEIMRIDREFRDPVPMLALASNDAE